MRQAVVHLTCGELLQRYRQVAGLTQEQLADQSGYSADYVGKLERGQRVPPASALNRFAEVLGLGDPERRGLLLARESRFTADPAVRPLVGRARERSAITRQLRGDGPAVLLLSGDPGIGKTRLLEEAAAAGVRSGWRVIEGGCQPGAGDPYGPLVQAIADSLRLLSGNERDAALAAASHLHLLLPELLGRAGTPLPDWRMGGLTSLPAAQERRLLFSAVLDYLGAIAGTAGTLLVLDDLQWAGQDALDLLAAAAGDRRESPLRVIGADRRSGAGSPVGELVARLSATQRAEVLSLEPLAEAESYELLVQLLATDGERAHSLLESVVKRAAGVPLFIVSYAEALRRSGDGGADLNVPATAAHVIRQQVAALPPRAREILGVATVAGRVVQADLLAQVTDRPEPQVVDALEAALDARLLKEEEQAGYQFEHDLVRETIQNDLSAARRRLWHRRLGAALAALPEHRRRGDEAEIASHFHRAGDLAHALPWTVEAADAAAAAFAHVDAERHYRAALALADELGDAHGAAMTGVKLGDMLYHLGRFAEAIVTLERAADAYRRSGHDESQLATVARAMHAFQFSGRIVEGIERAAPAVQALEAGAAEGTGAADVYAALCSLHLSAGNVSDALATADKAVSIGENAGNDRAVFVSEIVRGFALGAFGRLAEQRDAFHHATRIALPLGDPWMLSTALLQEASTYLAVQDLAEGERLTRRALEVAEEARLLTTAFFIRSKLADVLIIRGRWTDGRREAERADVDSRTVAPGIGHTYLLVTLGRILLLQGERDDGMRHLQEALAIATDLHYPHGIVHVSQTLAWQAVRDGDAAGAIARLEPILEASRAAGLPAYPAVYAWAQLEAGNEKRAAEILAGGRSLAAAGSAAVPLDVLLHAARLATRQRRWDDAVADLEAGLDGALASGLPYERALLLEAYGRLEADRGQRGLAAQRLEAALSVLCELGATPDAERVRHALLALST